MQGPGTLHFKWRSTRAPALLELFRFTLDWHLDHWPLELTGRVLSLNPVVKQQVPYIHLCRLATAVLDSK